MQTGPVMLHFGHIFPKVVHFSRNRVLFLYVFAYQMIQGKTRISIITICVLVLQALMFPVFAQSDPGAAIVSAVECQSRKEYDKAENILKDLIAADAKCDAAWYYLGMNYIAKSDTEMAEECFQAAAAIDPSNFWYRYRLASLYALTSREELTIDMYEKLLEDFPKKSDLYFSLVELYSSQGELEKALSTLSEIETVFGMTESIAMYRFNLLLRLDRKQEAYKSLEEYNSKYSSPYVLSALADQYLSEYQDSLALSYFNEALEMDSEYAPAVIGRAEVMRMTMRYDDYFRYLNDYISLGTESVAAKSAYLSAVLRGVDRKFTTRFSSQLDAVMEKTLEVHPGDSTMLNLSGLYYYSTGRPDEAMKRFRQNAESHPESLSATAGYVEFLMYSQAWESLSQESRKAYERFPKDVTFLELAAVAEHNLERFDEVIELCDRILTIEHADTASVVRAWSTKGDVYYSLGEEKKAYKSYEKALKLVPDQVTVLNNYAYYLCERGKNLKKAYQMSKTVIEKEPDNATYLDTFGWILYLMGKPEEAKPHFKRAMLYGGKDSPVILDHYAEVLFALGEYPLARVYWDKALKINNGQIKDLEERVSRRKKQMEKGK